MTRHRRGLKKFQCIGHLTYFKGCMYWAKKDIFKKKETKEKKMQQHKKNCAEKKKGINSGP